MTRPTPLPDPNWIQCGHSDDLAAVVTRYQNWEQDRIRLGFYPGSVGIVATGDPRGCWEVEVTRRLFDMSFSEVW
jgi:hypothetical protein